MQLLKFDDNLKVPAAAALQLLRSLQVNKLCL